MASAAPKMEPPDDQSAGAAFRRYELNGSYDEMFRSADVPRKQYRQLYTQLLNLGPDELRRSKQEADQSFFNQGITFTVYGSDKGTERIFPHDLLPRIITAAEWETIERGLTQRITALNLFLKDVYHDAKIIEDGVVPAKIVYTCKHYRREMRGIKVPRDVYVSVVGTDLIRTPEGNFVVLEDNLRVPSGVSYMLTSRRVMKHIPRAVSQMPGAADRTIQPGAAIGIEIVGTGRPDRTYRGAADAGFVQLRVF